MFPAGFFAKTYFAGTYWHPNDGGLIISTPSGGELIQSYMRRRRFR